MNLRDRDIIANGLRHHVLEWTSDARDERADRDGADTIVLCHGFLDTALSFEPLAERLCAAGHRVVAFDFRGHGRTAWIGAGGYYHFPDYVLDLDRLLPQLAGGRVHLLGHSMGATVCALYAGVRPARLRSLTLVEGLGPPEASFEATPERFSDWLDGVGRVDTKGTTRGGGAHPAGSVAARAAGRRVMPDEAAALARMRIGNPRLSDALGARLARYATEPGPGGEGRVWTFDPLHRTTSPMPFRVALFEAFARRVRAPTLVVVAEHGLRLPDERARLGFFDDARLAEIPGCGHMVHRDEPDSLARLVLEHTRERPTA